MRRLENLRGGRIRTNLNFLTSNSTSNSASFIKSVSKDLNKGLNCRRKTSRESWRGRSRRSRRGWETSSNPCLNTRTECQGSAFFSLQRIDVNRDPNCCPYLIVRPDLKDECSNSCYCGRNDGKRHLHFGHKSRQKCTSH